MSSERPVLESKSAFFEIFHQSWDELDTVISRLSKEEMTGPVDAAGWNVRDHLAHLVHWERGMIGMLKQDLQYQATGLSLDAWKSDDYDRMNEELRLQTLDDDPNAVIDRLRQSNETLLAMVDALPEALLLSPVRDFCLDRAENPEEWSVLQVLHGDAGEHFAEHRPWILTILDSQSAA